MQVRYYFILSFPLLQKWLKILVFCLILILYQSIYAHGRPTLNFCYKCLFLTLKVTQRKNTEQDIFVISTRHFCNITCTFKSTSLRLFRFKISQIVLFRIKIPQNLSKICIKGTNCDILNLNYRRLGRLKVHAI